MKALILVLLFAQGAGQVVLSGRVTDSVTHQPVTGALVQYQSVDAVTDANGAWSLNVRPFVTNREMMISKKGYAEFRQYFTLRSGGPETHDFELSPPAHLSGRLIDRDTGKPVKGMVATLQGSGKTFHSHATDEDGSFSIFEELPPGSYLLELRPDTQARFLSGKAKPWKPAEPAYGRTWFPDAPRPDMAAPITLLDGETRTIDMKIHKREFRHIDGFLKAPEGREGEPVRIRLTSRERGSTAGGQLDGSGAFRIEGLEEGSYELSAEYRVAAKFAPGKGFDFIPVRKRAFAVREVEIHGRDIEDVELVLRPGVSIQAVVEMAEKDGKMPDRPALFVAGMPWSAAHRGGPGDNRDPLRVEGIAPGEYWPQLVLPAGYVVASVNYNGAEVFHTPVDIEASESAIYFTITSRPGSIAGIARDKDRNPVDGATIALLPQPVPVTMEKFDPAALKVQEADTSGRFRFSGLAPGKYQAVALIGPDRERAHDLAFLRDRMLYADTIDLDFGQTATVELQVK